VINLVDCVNLTNNTISAIIAHIKREKLREKT